MPRLFLIIIIFIASYYLISRYLFPYLVRSFVKKAQEKFSGYGQEQKKEEMKKEGEVSVKYVPPETSQQKFNPDTTEDVDFEEVKDK
jgi:hypothetical protein